MQHGWYSENSLQSTPKSTDWLSEWFWFWAMGLWRLRPLRLARTFCRSSPEVMIHIYVCTTSLPDFSSCWHGRAAPTGKNRRQQMATTAGSSIRAKEGIIIIMQATCTRCPPGPSPLPSTTQATLFRSSFPRSDCQITVPGRRRRLNLAHEARAWVVGVGSDIMLFLWECCMFL